ncbi:MAG: hypothetical protein Q9157_005492 [Trypethelium eluteriae]
MAAKEVVLLSSSPIQSLEIAETPPAAQRRAVHATSWLSPDLPSPTRLLKVKTNALRTGSRAAQIPQGATTGFTSAATLLKDTQSSDDTHAHGGRESAAVDASRISSLDSSRTVGTLVERGKRTKKQQLTDENTNPSSEKAKAGGSNDDPDTDFQDSVIDVSVLEIPESPDVAQAARSLPTPPPAPASLSAIRRKGASNNDPKQQTKIKKGRVTKPRVARGVSKQLKDSSKQKVRQRSTGATSEHFQHHDVAIPPEMAQKPSKEVTNGLTITDELANDTPLLLEQATARRTDWTPPRACQEAPSEPEIISPTGDGSKDGKDEGRSKKSFPDFCGHFHYPNQPIKPPSISPEKSPRITSGESYPKKRRVELIAISTSALDPSTTETTKKPSRSPKKKPTTITALATAQYRPARFSPSTSNSFSKLFGPERATSSDVETRSDLKASAPVQEGIKAAGRRKSPSKESRDKIDKRNGRKASKTQKSVRGRKRLYSPEAAMKRAERQDLVFGSSSQLASGESPSFIRDMQQAIRESEAATPVPGAASNMAMTDPKYSRQPFSLAGAARGLWSAAARDHDNGTLSPEFKQSEAQPSVSSEEKEASFVHIDDVETKTQVAWQRRKGIQSFGSASVDGKHANSPSLVDETGTDFIPVDGIATKETERRSVHRKDALDTFSDVARSGAEQECRQALLARQPNGETTNPLCVKPVKKARGRPRKDPSQAPKPRNPRKAPASDSGQTTSTKQRRSRTSKKNNSHPTEKDEWQDIDEISDYEAPPTPSPPRRRASQSPHPPQALDLASTASNPVAEKPAPKQSRKPGKKPPPFSSTSKASYFGPTTTDERALWPSVAERLFPFLTTTVKAAPRSSDPNRPSWHEKMLMYDPIVAEDLTEWLKDRVEAETEFEGWQWEWWQRGKGLRAWMVRRWCEEMGVCCVMREGGWRRDGRTEAVQGTVPEAASG